MNQEDFMPLADLKELCKKTTKYTVNRLADLIYNRIQEHRRERFSDFSEDIYYSIIYDELEFGRIEDIELQTIFRNRWKKIAEVHYMSLVQTVEFANELLFKIAEARKKVVKEIEKEIQHEQKS